MPASLLIAWKDLRQRFRDRSAIMLAVVVPLALAAIFSMIFGPASTPTAFEYALVDEDRSPVSRSFDEDVLAYLEDEGIATVDEMEEAEARTAVSDGDLDAAFLIPPGFADRVQSRAPARLEVVGSVDAATATDVARSVASSYVQGLNAVRVAVAGVAHQGGSLTEGELQEVAQQTVAAAPPVTIEDISADAHVLDLKTYFAAGMAVFFLLFTVQFGVSSLIEERSDGTLSRLLAAPVRRSSILVGKLLTSVALGVVSLTVLVLGTSLLLGASWGNPVGVGLLVVSGVLAATGIASVVASLAKTAEQAGSWQAVVAVSLGLLGGAFFPVQQSGQLMATVSLVTPHAWFMRGLGTLAGGGEALAVLPAVGALLLIAAVTGAVASTRLGRIVEP